MGVYVKGMEMPKNCMECPFSDHEAWCLIPGDSKKRYYCPTEVISEHCPLVEVPEPHGKLVEFIDVTTYEDDDSGTEEVNLGEAFAAYFKMREAKPVIEAEGTDEGSN